MNIHETIEFDKEGQPVPKDTNRGWLRKFFLTLVILPVGLLGFGVGRLTAGQARGGVEIKMEGIETASTKSEAIPAASAEASASQVYASSKGTRYYYANCKSSVSEANKVTFASAAMAEAAGYTLALGCKKP